MPQMSRTITAFLLLIILNLAPAIASEEAPLTPALVLENSTAADWRQPDPDNVLIMTLDHGRVILELAPDFAPNHVANIKTLVAQKYFDGLGVIRSQDNYVAQWGDSAEKPEDARSLGDAKQTLEPEFERPLEGINYTPINSRDSYADQVGFSSGFTVASDDDSVWLTHCYGALGAGRGLEANSGNASSLYVVTGHSPRHLDKNVTLLGRVIQGMEHLSSLPRGTGTLGFYETPEEIVPIKSIRLASELDDDEKLNLEILRTDTQTFKNYVTSRTHRKSEWFLNEAGKIELCNVGVPVREIAAKTVE